MQRWTQKLALFYILAIGYILRVIHLRRPVTGDESHTYLDFVHPGLLNILTNYTEPNNHVFHSLLAWVSTSIGNNDLMFLRLPAFFAGILLIPLSYHAGRHLYNEIAGLLAAGIVAIAVPLLEYSISARGYTIVLCIFTAQIILAQDLLHERTTWKWIVFAGLSALGFYTVPIMLFPMGTVALWMMLEMIVARRWWQIIRLVSWLALGAILTILLYTPIIVVSGLDAIVGNKWVTGKTFDHFLRLLWEQPYSLLINTRQGIPKYLMYTLLLLAIGSIPLQWRLSRNKFPIGLVALLWWLSVVWIQQTVGPWRTMLHFVVLFALHVGAGFSVLTWNPRTQRWVVPLIMALVTIIGANIIRTNRLENSIIYDKQAGAQEAAIAMARYIEPDDEVIVATGFITAFQYYLFQNDMRYDMLHLNMPREEALALARDGSLYLLTIQGDPYTTDRVIEALQIDLNDPAYKIVPLTPDDPMILNRFILTKASTDG